MNRLQPKDITKLQDVLRRGTVVKIHDQKEDVFFEGEYSGFVDYDCPYRYCELHPKNPGKNKDMKACDGFMKWIINEVEQESCPYLGGAQLTAGDQQIITEIKSKKKDPRTGEFEESWSDPLTYLK
jgi:hypothetical protein